MHPHILYQLAKDRQRERIEEAERYRMVMQARAGQPGVISRVLEKLGGLLVKIGQKLQRQSAPQPPGTLGWAEK